MNEAAKEPKPLPNILPIVANVIFRDSRVNCQKTLHALRLREQVCSVPQLRRLGYYCLPQVKNILVAEQVKTLRTTGVYEFLLKQFNPDNLDYGAWMEQRRQAFLEARIRNPYFGYSLFATLTLCLMTGVCAKMWIDHRRALWVTAEWMADVYNHDLYSREAAREAIQRYNEHIERCNRAIEAGESGHSMLNEASAETEALRAELQRVGTDLIAAKRENEVIQEQLRSKTTLVTEMSLRLEALSKRSGPNADGTQGPDLHGANPDLVKHINGLQEQLYAERQKNRQLKGA